MPDLLGPFPQLTRFALDELRTEDDRAVVLVLFETTTNTGDVTRTEMVVEPQEAARIGRQLAAIGIALQATRH